ncbi:MAG TPA: RAD55 family ATPase [Candidatus Thermoplasmatota archaeon]|nr:RAD55 family ATPase [Candidatus Thermoplasmatota archaeon]
MPLVTTGISGLDAQLGGGIPSGTTLLLIAEPGNAMSLFSEQFAAGGLGAGESVHYLLFDRPAKDARDHVLSFLPTATVAQKAQKLKFYDGYSPQFGRALPTPPGKDETVTIGRDDAYSQPLKEVQRTGYDGPYRLVFETLSTIATSGGEEAAVEFFRTLTFLGRETGGVHLVSLVKGLHSPLFETKLRHLAGGVLEFGIERKGFGLYPYVMISKLLNVPEAARILLYKETERGLWLEPTKRVF